MTNLIYIDRSSKAAFNNFLCGGLAIFIFFISNFFPPLVWIGLLLVLKIIFSLLRLTLIKNKVSKSASCVNGYSKAMKIGPESFGVFEVKNGVLVFTDLSGETVEVFDSNGLGDIVPSLRVELLDALTHYQFKKVIVHKGLSAWILPVEVWNLLYEDLKPFKIESMSIGSLGSTRKYVAFGIFIIFAVFPLFTKIILNFIFGDYFLHNVRFFDLILPILGILPSMFSLFFRRKKEKTPLDVKEGVLKNDPRFVKGFSIEQDLQG